MPLTEIKEIELLDNDEIILGWADNETIKIKSIKREQEVKYLHNGSQRSVIVSETEVRRLININGSQAFI